MADRIKIRRDIYENWYDFNPVLAEGEVGIVTHSGSVALNPLWCKVGDGVSNWRNLPRQAWAEPGLSGSLSTRIDEVSGSLESLRDNIGYYPCTTAAGTAAKVISVADALEYSVMTGGAFKVKFSAKNTATSNVTLKVGNAASASLYYDGAPVTNLNTWENNETVDIYFDGTNYMGNNVSGGGTFATGEKVKNVGIDDEPTAGSDNLVKSGGVKSESNRIEQKFDTKVSELSNNKSDVRVFSNNGLLIKNGYINTSGGFTPTPSGNSKYVLLPVVEGQQITLHCISSSDKYAVLCDSETHYTTSVTINLGENQITIPNGITYLAFQHILNSSYKFDYFYTNTDKNVIHNICKFNTGELVSEVGMETEPTVCSNNLVKSGGIFKKIKEEIKEADNKLILEPSPEQTINLKSEVAWLDGYYHIDDNGQLIEHSSVYKTSDYITLPLNTKTVNYKGGVAAGTSYKQVAIYTDNNDCLGVFAQYPIDQGVSFDISNLFGATKMRISEYDYYVSQDTWDISANVEITISNQSIFENYKSSVNERFSNLNDEYSFSEPIDVETNLKNNVVWLDGNYYIGVDGTLITASSTGKVSEYIDLPPNTKSIKYSGGVDVSSRHYHCAIYDAQNNCLATFRDSNVSAVNPVVFDITEYPTATKMRIGEWTSFINNNTWNISVTHSVHQTNKETYDELLAWIDSLNQWKGRKFIAFGASNTSGGFDSGTAWIQMAAERLKMQPPISGMASRRVSLKYVDGALNLVGLAATIAECQSISASTTISYETQFAKDFDCVLFGGFAGESYDESQVVIDGTTYYGGEELIDLVKLPTTRYNNNPQFTYSNGDTLAQHRDSYIGAVIYVLNELWKIKPTCRVVFTRAYLNWGNYDSYSRNFNGIKKLCDKLHLPFIDLVEGVYFNGFTTGTGAEEDKTNPNLYLYDGEHATLAGRQRLANIFTHRLLLLD